jgi:RHS repeat-associated protein
MMPKTGNTEVKICDSDSMCVKVVSNGGAPIYYVKSSVLGQVAMEIEGSQAALNRAYVYANGKLMAEQTPDGQFYWTHNDHLNSTRKLTSASGAVVYRGEFDPYGKAALETGSVSLNSHKYTGYERDWATGLDYANARMYTSQYGRFMQSDPVTQGCGNRNPEILAGANQRLPESLNRYGYVRNDPVNLIDPSGLYGETPEEADLLCALGVLEFCGWRGRPRTPECYYSKAGCGNGGGGWGGFPPLPQISCDECCDSETATCRIILGACMTPVVGALAAGIINCNNNPFCIEGNPAYDEDRCGKCKLAFYVIAAGGTAACLLLYTNCLRGRSAKCKDAVPKPCKCIGV